MNGVIYMTALVPTLGHQRLIDFGMNFLKSLDPNSKLTVIVSSRSFEPEITKDRVEILRSVYRDTIVEFVDHRDDLAPQNCETEEDWNYWTSMVSDIQYVFGSEEYCKELSARLNAQYIPCDPYREVSPIKGSFVREDVAKRFPLIMPEWVAAKETKVILFGQESVGKTTLAKTLASKVYATNAHHEWARPYLESVGSELSSEKMLNIVHGQHALEQIQSKTLISIYDTDLLSTLGYYRIMEMEPPKILLDYVSAYTQKNNRLYLIPSDGGVPFEKDPLRYGGDKRQSTMDFWIELLDEYNLPYKILEGSFMERIKMACFFIDEFSKIDELKMFVRD